MTVHFCQQLFVRLSALNIESENTLTCRKLLEFAGHDETLNPFKPVLNSKNSRENSYHKPSLLCVCTDDCLLTFMFCHIDCTQNECVSVDFNVTVCKVGGPTV